MGAVSAQGRIRKPAAASPRRSPASRGDRRTSCCRTPASGPARASV